jgi:hypothetical protein
MTYLNGPKKEYGLKLLPGRNTDIRMTRGRNRGGDMIPEERNMPKIIHSTVDLKEKKRLTNLVSHFFKDVVLPKALEKQREGYTGWDDPENLLELRKKLVHHIKKGMLERKDGEEDIALLAAFIWYHRLEQEKREALDAEWG